MLQKAYEINNSSAAIWNYYGMISFEKGDLLTAKILYERALKLDPEYSETYYNYGKMWEVGG